MGHHHRSTLKQKNKTFKKTKKSTGKTGISHKQTVSSRVDRKNTLRQLRVQKTVATQYNRKIVAIVPLCSDADTQQVKLQIDSSKLWAFALKRDLLEIIQGVQVADFVLFVLSSNNEVDAFGEQVMSCIKTMGVPTVVCCAQFLTQHPIKQQALIRGSLMYYMKHHFPTEEKMYCLDSEKELAQCMRYLTTHIPKGISWRDRHGYIVADGVEYKANGDDPEVCTLVLHGEVRGGCLSANRLLHIPSVGDFQIGRILAQHKENVLEVADPMHQETLQVENELDPLDAEQTWPTDMEIEEAQACVDRKEHEVEHVPFEAPASITRRVPKGTSAYQAAWILDQADEPDSEIIPNDESFPLLQDQNDSSEEEVEYEDIEMDNKSVKFDLLDEDEEKEQLQEYLDRQEENKTHREFPDEVDTPLNMAASVRFARYRGLKSVRSSPWDPYENLPEDYGRIFQFQNLRRSKKRALDSTREGVLPGTAVSIEILNFPVSAQTSIASRQLVAAFGLLPYENKLSVINFQITRSATGYTEPVKSKDPMIIMCGFRMLVANPVYSTYTRGGSNNVHKFERYLNMRPSTATMYGPIQFGPTPIMMFHPSAKWTPGSPSSLIGYGTILDPAPQRIIAKRIVLTGHPFKIHKRGAVIRFLFYTREDIEYFKPVQLATKHGRIGHMKEALGTHGYIKCIFDGPIKQHDTVMMHLYKRVFPKKQAQMYVRDVSSKDMELTQVENDDIEMGN